MRIFSCAAALALLSSAGVAQQTSTSTATSVDINGYRVASGPAVVTSRSKDHSETSERVASINGRSAPLEKIEETVLRDDASGRTVERIIRRYDQTGNPAGIEKSVIEEQKSPNGNSTATATRYQSDVNGRLAIVERSVTQKQVNGEVTTADSIVERPTIDNSLAPVEKRNIVTIKQPNGYQETATTFRRDQNGAYNPASRRVTDHTENAGQAVDNTADYEPNPSGDLELYGQTVSRTHKEPNGSADTEVDIFGRNVPGTTNDTRALQLKEHQLVERRVKGTHEVVETVEVQRPSVSDPNALGPPRQISQTVCRGECAPQQP